MSAFPAARNPYGPGCSDFWPSENQTNWPRSISGHWKSRHHGECPDSRRPEIHVSWHVWMSGHQETKQTSQGVSLATANPDIMSYVCCSGGQKSTTYEPVFHPLPKYILFLKNLNQFQGPLKASHGQKGGHFWLPEIICLPTECHLGLPKPSPCHSNYFSGQEAPWGLKPLPGHQDCLFTICLTNCEHIPRNAICT